MNIKNIILNTLGIVLYQIAIFILFLWGYTIFVFILFFIIEIYLLIVLLNKNNKILAFISIINFLIPLHVIFFILNIFLKPKKKDKKEKPKEYYLNFNKFLLKFSPIMIGINVLLIFLEFWEFALHNLLLKVEIILIYFMSVLRFILFNEVDELLLYYITKPIVIICFLLIIIYYTYLISIIIYFIKRKQPLRAFKILVFNFLTFGLYSIVYLKSDRNLLINSEIEKDNFEIARKHNTFHRSFFIKKLLVHSLAFVILLIFMTSWHNLYFLEDYSNIKKVDDNSMVINFLVDDYNINDEIYQTLGEGLYTIEPSDNNKYNTGIYLFDYQLFLRGPENYSKVYNFPVNKNIESSIEIETIFDYQPLKITKQEGYIEYKEKDRGFYKVTPEMILKVFNDDDDFGFYNIYNTDLKTSIEIFEDHDTYEVDTQKKTDTTEEDFSYNKRKYTKEEFKKELDKNIKYNFYAAF